MTPYTKRGLPPGLAKDAWWLNAPPDGRHGAGDAVTPSLPPFGVALGGVCFIALMDWTFFNPTGGAVLAIFTTAFALILTLILRRGKGWAWDIPVIAIVSILPVLSFVQTLSVWFWMLGIMLLVARAADWPLARVGTLWLRLPWAGVRKLVTVEQSRLARSRMPGLRLMREWGIAVGIGSVFVLLFALANPVIDEFLNSAFSGLISIEWGVVRLGLWVFSALMILMIFSAAYIPHPAPRSRRGFALPMSTIRNALLVFNLIFAGQLVTDIFVLGFGAGLPDGMTYASYAHRGAYPLLVTALLSGAFMLIARHTAKESGWVRVLLAIWTLQNMILLGTAAYRLGLYVDAYGWTYWRLHCFVWLGLVAFGLCLVAYDLWRTRSAQWILNRSAIASIVVLYVACFVNFGEWITQANLNRFDKGKRVDWVYMCNLGLSNHALLSEVRSDYEFQPNYRSHYHKPLESWRQWDFRRWQTDQRIAKVSSDERLPLCPTAY